MLSFSVPKMRFTPVNSLALAVLLLAVLAALCTTATASRSAINLDVSRNFDPSGRPGGLVINCSIDPSAAEIDTVASVTVFGSRPYGRGSDLDQLAVFDIWSKSPKLADELEEADVSVAGDISSDSSHLALTWRSPTVGARQAYRCLANGIDREGQATSVSTTVQVEPVGAGCCHKIDALKAGLSGLSDVVGGTFNLTGDVASQIQSVNTKIGNMDAKKTIADGIVTSQVQSLADKSDEIQVKLDDLDGKMSSQVQTLTSNVQEIDDRLRAFEQNMNRQFKIFGIDKGIFEVSSAYQGKVYLVSKTVKAFNIGTANNQCRGSGGYLVELDDAQEYQFVFDLVSRIGGANSFWTGGNDIDKEGTFVYYNSKKPIPALTWSSAGQPDNNGGNEDCMEIRLNFGGLNDWGCNQQGKFVCEVPL